MRMLNDTPPDLDAGQRKMIERMKVSVAKILKQVPVVASIRVLETDVDDNSFIYPCNNGYVLEEKDNAEDFGKFWLTTDRPPGTLFTYKYLQNYWSDRKFEREMGNVPDAVAAIMERLTTEVFAYFVGSIFDDILHKRHNIRTIHILTGNTGGKTSFARLLKNAFRVWPDRPYKTRVGDLKRDSFHTTQSTSNEHMRVWIDNDLGHYEEESVVPGGSQRLREYLDAEEVFLLRKGHSGYAAKTRLSSILWTSNNLPEIEYHYPENARRTLVYFMPVGLMAGDRDDSIYNACYEDKQVGEYMFNYGLRAIFEIDSTEPEFLYKHKRTAALTSQAHVLAARIKHESPSTRPEDDMDIDLLDLRANKAACDYSEGAV